MCAMARVYLHPSSVGLFSAAILLCCVYCVSLAIYRLFFSPLKEFPGPKIAALTHWYEFYYDWWLGGKYIFEIEKLHNKYGPIIRINPEELSIHDPAFYNDIYVVDFRRRSETYDAFVRGINFNDSFLLTKDHDLHKNRRRAFEAFFSRKGIMSINSTLAEVALKLETRFNEFKGTGQIIRLDHAFSSYSGDVIGRVCLGDAVAKHELLDDADFSSKWYNVIQQLIMQIPLFTGFPGLIRLVQLVPERYLLWVFPQAQSFNTFAETIKSHLRDVASRKPNKEYKNKSVFQSVLDSDMPTAEKSEARLTKEAQTIIAAGTVTTSRTIVTASYYILANPALHSRLQAELESTMRDWPRSTPTVSDLEKLPLLQAIVKESLRIGYGVMHRLPRVSPDEDILYDKYRIPAGVPVGMSAYLMHRDPTIFPKPDSFNPDRWIDHATLAMHQSCVPFCKGSRSCIGIHLALSEISLILAVLFRHGGPQLELFETDQSDVELVHDMIIPLPRFDSKGIRVIVKE